MKIDEIIENARNTIIKSFNDLEFLEGPHKYFRTMNDGQRIEYTPVSNIISKWELPFDNDTISKNYALKNNLKVEDVKRKWKYINLLATTTGTLVHEYGESMGWLKGGFPDKITPLCQHQYVKEENWLIPTRPKEVAIKKFWDELNNSLHFVGAEFKMHSGYLGCETKMSGTFDLLLYYDNPDKNKKSGFVLCDWKTNANLFKEYNELHKKMMLSPFDDMFEEPFSHYKLQFACYQLMLESIGIPIIGRRLIWLKDDESYEVLKVEDLTKKMIKLL